MDMDSAISQMQNWALAMGAPTAPLVSPSFLQRMVGAKSASHRGEGRRGEYSSRSRRRVSGRDGDNWFDTDKGRDRTPHWEGRGRKGKGRRQTI